MDEQWPEFLMALAALLLPLLLAWGFVTLQARRGHVKGPSHNEAHSSHGKFR